MCIRDSVTGRVPPLSSSLKPATTAAKEIKGLIDDSVQKVEAVSYTHLTLPTIHYKCIYRWSPYN